MSPQSEHAGVVTIKGWGLDVAIPVTAKTKVIAWVLCGVVTAGTLIHQMMLRNEIEECRTIQYFLLQQLREQKGQPPISKLPPWESNFPSHTTLPTQGRMLPIAPLNRLFPGSFSQSKADSQSTRSQE